jgi:serine/threonine protein kinase
VITTSDFSNTGTVTPPLPLVGRVVKAVTEGDNRGMVEASAFPGIGFVEDLPAGTKVGEFVVEYRLGEGGMSTIFAAVHPVIGKKAAIKVISRQLAMSRQSVKRFIQEARAVNQIGHPNIVDVFSFGNLPDGRPYLIMEWLQGETLLQRIARGAIGVEETADILCQVCEALEAAHDNGIVHRDLKPANVYLTSVRGQRLLVKLLDFGIAKLRGRGRLLSTGVGARIGTPTYMSPEQSEGRHIDPRSDVYSLGVMAFEMLAAVRPFEDQGFPTLEAASVGPPSVRALRPEVPAALDELLQQMLARSRDLRPSMAHIHRQLLQFRSEGQSPARVSIEGPLLSASAPGVTHDEHGASTQDETGLRGGVMAVATPSPDSFVGLAVYAGSMPTRVDHGPLSPGTAVSSVSGAGLGAPTPLLLDTRGEYLPGVPGTIDREAAQEVSARLASVSGPPTILPGPLTLVAADAETGAWQALAPEGDEALRRGSSARTWMRLGLVAVALGLGALLAVGFVGNARRRVAPAEEAGPAASKPASRSVEAPSGPAVTPEPARSSQAGAPVVEPVAAPAAPAPAVAEPAPAAAAPAAAAPAAAEVAARPADRGETAARPAPERSRTVRRAAARRSADSESRPRQPSRARSGKARGDNYVLDPFAE